MEYNFRYDIKNINEYKGWRDIKIRPDLLNNFIDQINDEWKYYIKNPLLYKIAYLSKNGINLKRERGWPKTIITWYKVINKITEWFITNLNSKIRQRELLDKLLDYEYDYDNAMIIEEYNKNKDIKEYD